jgi:hypothetical protein
VRAGKTRSSDVGPSRHYHTTRKARSAADSGLQSLPQTARAPDGAASDERPSQSESVRLRRLPLVPAAGGLTGRLSKSIPRVLLRTHA